MNGKFEYYANQVEATYTPERAIAYAILALAEAIRYHADVTAPILPENNAFDQDKYLDGSDEA